MEQDPGLVLLGSLFLAGTSTSLFVQGLARVRVSLSTVSSSPRIRDVKAERRVTHSEEKDRDIEEAEAEFGVFEEKSANVSRTLFTDTGGDDESEEDEDESK